VLAIETSCDETAVAVIGENFKIHSNVVYSQLDEHAPYGGVVPEIASRRHLELLPSIVERALTIADVEPRSVAVTIGPGLMGSLLIGVAFAKSFALARNLPIYGIHHISGHLHAILLEEPNWKPPFLALTVSGGHTELVYVCAWGKYEYIARTIDDAAGEAFDKAAKLLGLGTPGGPKLAALAEQAGDTRIKLAGRLKTALKRNLGNDPAVLAASFQDEVVAALCHKTEDAIAATSATQLLLTGGVAANRQLRKAMKEMAERRGIAFAVPRIEHCTDNAAMIGAAALAYPHHLLPPTASPRASMELI